MLKPPVDSEMVAALWESIRMIFSDSYRQSAAAKWIEILGVEDAYVSDAPVMVPGLRSDLAQLFSDAEGPMRTESGNP